jgi:release factor glutamine methyltransferase
MLARELVAALPTGGTASVLELCTGSGAIALEAAGAGADVTAVDVSRRSVATVRLNARLRGLRVRALRGSLFEPVAGETFDLIATNPPYMPATSDPLPTAGPARALDAGRDGRAFIDPICDAAPAHLEPGGAILIIHSSVCGIEATVTRLERGGLDADVPFRHHGPLGPVLTARAGHLEAIGALEPGEREEDVVIVRGRKPAA